MKGKTKKHVVDKVLLRSSQLRYQSKGLQLTDKILEITVQYSKDDEMF